MVAKQTKIIAVVVVVLLIAVAILAVVLVPSSNNTKTGYRIVANVNKDCAGTPWFVGEDIGYFARGGIDFVDAGALDWSLQPAALISGQTNVYDGHPNTLINLLESGAKIKGVVMGSIDPDDYNLTEQHMHWLVLSSSGIKTIHDLVANGSKPKIAVGAEGICADLENNAWFRQNNLTKDDFQYVVLSDPLQEAALRAGQIDVAVLHPPFYTAAEAHGGVTIVAKSEDTLGIYAGVSMLAFTEDFIQKNPDAVRAFIIAYKNAERWSNDWREQSGQLTAGRIGLTTANSHYYSYSGAINDTAIQVWIDAMVADGLLKKGQYVPSDLYTTEFSDTWVAPTQKQPLNPFGLSTLINSTWVNQTGATTTYSSYDAYVISQGTTNNLYADVEKNLNTGNIVQPRSSSSRDW
ncbi:MAG: ABC transporter substrate-binding protein [Methanomassiliicoccales archaeon]|jgi:ABC-type nitrate/sulfonate/bicarbonate transport system substrate-binding protein